MHLPIYNCTYHATPTLLSWGRLQWQQQTDVCLTRMRHNYEESVQQEFWNHSVPGRVSFRKSSLCTAVPLTDRERTTRWLISTAPLIGADGCLPSWLSLGSHFCVRSTAVHAHTSAQTDWLMHVCMHTHTLTHSLSLTHIHISKQVTQGTPNPSKLNDSTQIKSENAEDPTKTHKKQGKQNNSNTYDNLLPEEKCMSRVRFLLILGLRCWTILYRCSHLKETITRSTSSLRERKEIMAAVFWSWRALTISLPTILLVHVSLKQK